MKVVRLSILFCTYWPFWLPFDQMIYYFFIIYYFNWLFTYYCWVIIFYILCQVYIYIYKINIFYQSKIYWFLNVNYWILTISNLEKSEFCYVGSFVSCFCCILWNLCLSYTNMSPFSSRPSSKRFNVSLVCF